MLKIATKTTLPTAYGHFTLMSFDGFEDGLEHLALIYGDVTGKKDVLARIHSECLTGEVFGSRRCDCQPQLQDAMQAMAANGSGVVLYLRQEGRGIGLKNKLRAYELQDKGMDTVEANAALGFENDLRSFAPAVEMLRVLDVASVKLMTNNPDKMAALLEADITVSHVPLLSCVAADNVAYMETKADKMGHLIPAEFFANLKKTRA